MIHSLCQVVLEYAISKRDVRIQQVDQIGPRRILDEAGIAEERGRALIVLGEEHGGIVCIVALEGAWEAVETGVTLNYDGRCLHGWVICENWIVKSRLRIAEVKSRTLLLDSIWD